MGTSSLVRSAQSILDPSGLTTIGTRPGPSATGVGAIDRLQAREDRGAVGPGAQPQRPRPPNVLPVPCSLLPQTTSEWGNPETTRSHCRIDTYPPRGPMRRVRQLPLRSDRGRSPSAVSDRGVHRSSCPSFGQAIVQSRHRWQSQRRAGSAQ